MALTKQQFKCPEKRTIDMTTRINTKTNVRTLIVVEHEEMLI